MGREGSMFVVFWWVGCFEGRLRLIGLLLPVGHEGSMSVSCLGGLAAWRQVEVGCFAGLWGLVAIGRGSSWFVCVPSGMSVLGERLRLVGLLLTVGREGSMFMMLGGVGWYLLIRGMVG